MTIITGRQFRANQSKYIDMAHKGERVILSSKKGYTELKPIAETDKEVEVYKQAASLTALAAKAEQDHKNGNTIKCNTIEELHSFLDSL